MKEYKLEVILTPHLHDNLENPYFWCVLENLGNGWHNVRSGWSCTLEDAFQAGRDAYDAYC